MMTSLRSWLMMAAVAMLAAAASAAYGNALMALALPENDQNGPYSSSSGRAITPDGRFVVGQISGGVAPFASKGMLWDAQTGEIISWCVSSDGAGAEISTGIGYRTVAPGVTQLIVHGYTGSGTNLYSSMDNGVTWGPKNRFLYTTYDNQSQGPANSLGSSGTDDIFYFGFSWHNGNQMNLVQGDNGTAPEYKANLTVSIKGLTNPDEGYIRGVSADGIAVGERAHKNYQLVWNGGGTPTPSYFNGLDGTNAGEAWSISNDGTTIFGRSPVSDGRTGLYPYMLRNGTISELPGLPGAENNPSNGVPYGASADGRYAVGMSYPGVEKAVLWDTEFDAVLDLNQYFTDAGLMGNFIRLSRAYSVGVDVGGTVWVTGQGAWSDDGGATIVTRGFVGLVASGPLGSCVETGWGYRSCRVTPEDSCVPFDPDHTVTWTEGQTCANQDCAIPFADTDSDGDVDQSDFAFLQSCHTGMIAEPPGLTGLCQCLDQATDSMINGLDLIAFENCATGPEIPWSSELTPDCVEGDGLFPQIPE